MNFSNAATRRQDAFQASRSASPASDWQTQIRGTNAQEFAIFLSCADDGKGNDRTHPGQPLPTFDEWMNR